MTAIDWSQPIEAVHEDGRVVPVTLRSKRNGYEVRPILNDERSDAVAIFQSDGTHKWNRLTTRPHRHVPWSIRNVAQPTLSHPTAPIPSEVGPEVGGMHDRDCGLLYDDGPGHCTCGDGEFAENANNSPEQRAVALVRHMAGMKVAKRYPTGVYGHEARYAFDEARAIAALLPEPVDADTQEAERIAYDMDGALPRDLVEAGIRRGRALAAEDW